MERLHIIDGYGYIYRAFFGLAGTRDRRGVTLSTAQGMPTGALYVYSSMLIRLHRDVKPEHIVVVFDAPGRNFRDELDQGYKATRRETPDDLKPQLPYFSRITEAFCWPTLAIPGVEADDVIATLVTKARARDWDVVVYSGDKDLMQLVDDHVLVVDSMREITYDAARVKEKFEVEPCQLRDFLALVGDTSDNVPGMPGVGKVTAAKLLARYGSIEGILAHVSELGGKQKETFSDADKLAKLELSRKLVTLKPDVELGVELDELKARPWDSTRLEELFRELEFHALIARLGPRAAGAGSASPKAGAGAGAGSDVAGAGAGEGAGEGRDVSSPEPAGSADAAEPAVAGSRGHGSARPALDIPEPVVATRPDDLREVIVAARQARRLALDVQTDGQRPDRARVIGVAMAAPGCAPVYIPLAHRYLGSPPAFAPADWPAELRDVLADPAIAVCCHDAKTVQRCLTSLGVAVKGMAGDTMLAAYLLDPDQDFALDRVMHATLGITLPSRESLLGKGKNRLEFESVAVERAASCSARGAYAVLFAQDELARRLERAGLSRLMNELELPLAVLLAEIEAIGICLDLPYLRELSRAVAGDIAALERKVYELAGEEFNMGSPKQLSELLFEKLGLKSEKMRKTKTGYSTDHEVLESLVDEHEIVGLIIEHRELIKLKGTYLDALPPLVNPATGRIHTSFNQAVAATGRLSSQDPNLQNIPIRTELGKKIRRAFVAAPGKVLVSVDYSQIELRILAHLSGDPVLIQAFRNDIDVHTQTAAEVFGIALEAVGAEERRVAKAVNYGLVYGQSQFGLSRALAIPRGEARVYIARYFERFATVREFMDSIIKEARRTGVVTTILGRRRHLADLQSRNFQRRQAAERMAKNTPIQGSAADIMKLAMLKVASRMARESYDARMLLTVHDELVFEVAPDQARAFAAVVASEMESAYELAVPLKATVGIGPSWADAH